MNVFRRKLQSCRESFTHFMYKKYTITMSPRAHELLAGSFIVVSAILTYIYGVVIILPEMLEGYPGSLCFMRILGSWLLTGILANYYLIRARNSSIANRMLIQPRVRQIPSNIQELNPELKVVEETKHMGEHFTPTPFGDSENWHICAICEVFVPPRTWHCHVCRTCILRRDHHCIFTGCCIGEENQGNFMGLVFYLAVGTSLVTAWALYYSIYYMNMTFLGFAFRAVVLVYTLFWDFDVKYILASVSAVGQFAAWGVFLYYFFNALKGQTSSDAHRKQYWTSPGCSRVSFKNMTEFLGPNPVLRIIWPFHQPYKKKYGDVSQYQNGEEERKGL